MYMLLLLINRGHVSRLFGIQHSVKVDELDIKSI